ncbi:phage portal protein, partial [Actinobacillus equuli subsp. equuli]
VSTLHSVLIRLADLKDYEESERVAARIAAALTMYIKKGDPAIYDAEEYASNTESNRYFDIAPGQVVDDLKPGEDIG